jgi:hypothetical protein
VTDQGDTTITLTREDVLAKRHALLDRYGLAEKDMEADDCGCCPKGSYIPWVAFHDWRTLNWLLDEEKA